MMIYADLHTHTVFSHGKGTMEDNVRAALERGLKAVAISDHGLNHIAYGITKREVYRYLDELDRLKDAYGDRIRVLSGVEANILGEDGAIDVPDWLDKRLDVVLMGFHRAAVSRFPQWMTFILANRNIPGDRAKRRQFERNTRAFVNAVRNNRVDVITHPMYIARMDIAEVARACQENHTLIEVNNKHGNVTREELAIAMAQGADFILGSDAHHPDRVGRVDDAAALAEDAGIPPERIWNCTEYAGTKRI